LRGHNRPTANISFLKENSSIPHDLTQQATQGQLAFGNKKVLAESVSTQRTYTQRADTRRTDRQRTDRQSTDKDKGPTRTKDRQGQRTDKDKGPTRTKDRQGQRTDKDKGTTEAAKRRQRKGTIGQMGIKNV
jgi:hypothetical protein